MIEVYAYAQVNPLSEILGADVYRDSADLPAKGKYHYWACATLSNNGYPSVLIHVYCNAQRFPAPRARDVINQRIMAMVGCLLFNECQGEEFIETPVGLHFGVWHNDSR